MNIGALVVSYTCIFILSDISFLSASLLTILDMVSHKWSASFTQIIICNHTNRYLICSCTRACKKKCANTNAKEWANSLLLVRGFLIGALIKLFTSYFWGHVVVCYVGCLNGSDCGCLVHGKFVDFLVGSL